MVTVEQKVSGMVKNLINYHWSPQHPSTYTINIGGQERGIGVIAHKNYGAFNLAWGSCNGRWQTKEDQHALVVSFSKFNPITAIHVSKEPLGDWACLLGPEGFKQLIVNTKDIVEVTRTELLQAADGAIHVQHV